jgi:ABC-2 type transport system ATP-binding protein
LMGGQNTQGTNGILSLRGVWKSYGDLVAVRDLSLDVRRGEVFGLLGPNGAGKTTAIKMICGLLQADAGQIRVDGLCLQTHYDICKRKLGLCPETLVVWENLTCFEQLAFMGQQYDLGREAAGARASQLLGDLHLAEKSRKLAKTLSSGMKRRLNLALALVHDPEILILDEPQAGLDPQSRILLRETMRALAQTKTVLLTTHDMDEVDRLADRVGIVDHGELLVLDTPENLKSRLGGRDILEVQFAHDPGERLYALRSRLPEGLRGWTYERGMLSMTDLKTVDVLPALLEVFRVEQLEVMDITIRKSTLEDVFIALTGRRLRE